MPGGVLERVIVFSLMCYSPDDPIFFIRSLQVHCSASSFELQSDLQRRGRPQAEDVQIPPASCHPLPRLQRDKVLRGHLRIWQVDKISVLEISSLIHFWVGEGSHQVPVFWWINCAFEAAKKSDKYVVVQEDWLLSNSNRRARGTGGEAHCAEDGPHLLHLLQLVQVPHGRHNSLWAPGAFQRKDLHRSQAEKEDDKVQEGSTRHPK